MLARRDSPAEPRFPALRTGVSVGAGVAAATVSTGGTGVTVGGTGVSVGGIGVSVGGIGVSVGGIGVRGNERGRRQALVSQSAELVFRSAGIGVSVGGTGVSVGS